MIRCVMILTLFIIGSQTASAAIDYSEVPGYMIFPLQERDVRLIRVSTSIDDKANAKSKYVLENTSDKEVSIDVGFPNLESWMERQFYLIVKADKVEVKPVKIDYSIPFDKRSIIGWSDDFKTNYENLFTWKITFKGKERKNIEVSFTTQWSSDHKCAPYCKSLIYINKPGMLWKGPIAEAEYFIKINEFYTKLLNRGDIRIVAKPNGYEIIDNNIISWNFKQWIPNQDIFVEFRKPIDIKKMANLETVDAVKIEYVHYRNKVPYYGDKRLYTQYDLESINIDRDDENDRFFIKVMRNEIFARHGRKFQSKNLQNVFNYQDWYKPNPNYSDDMFNDIEKKNIHFILEYEKKKGWR